MFIFGLLSGNYLLSIIGYFIHHQAKKEIAMAGRSQDAQVARRPLFGIKIAPKISFLYWPIVFTLAGLSQGTVKAVLLANGIGLSIFVISLLLHELGHIISAKKLARINTSRIELFLGGAAAVMEKDLSNSGVRAWKQLLIAFAGPAVSFVLMTIALLSGGQIMNTFTPAGATQFVQALTHINLQNIINLVATINLFAGIFNLILPVYPMDGGRIFKAFLEMCGVPSRIATKIAAGLTIAVAGTVAVAGAGLLAAPKVAGLMGFALILPTSGILSQVISGITSLNIIFIAGWLSWQAWQTFKGVVPMARRLQPAMPQRARASRRANRRAGEEIASGAVQPDEDMDLGLEGLAGIGGGLGMRPQAFGTTPIRAPPSPAMLDPGCNGEKQDVDENSLREANCLEIAKINKVIQVFVRALDNAVIAQAIPASDRIQELEERLHKLPVRIGRVSCGGCIVKDERG
jgi:Zn-dependent protease